MQDGRFDVVEAEVRADWRRPREANVDLVAHRLAIAKPDLNVRRPERPQAIGDPLGVFANRREVPHLGAQSGALAQLASHRERPADRPGAVAEAGDRELRTRQPLLDHVLTARHRVGEVGFIVHVKDPARSLSAPRLRDQRKSHLGGESQSGFAVAGRDRPWGGQPVRFEPAGGGELVGARGERGRLADDGDGPGSRPDQVRVRCERVEHRLDAAQDGDDSLLLADREQPVEEVRIFRERREEGTFNRVKAGGEMADACCDDPELAACESESLEYALTDVSANAEDEHRRRCGRYAPQGDGA